MFGRRKRFHFGDKSDAIQGQVLLLQNAEVTEFLSVSLGVLRHPALPYHGARAIFCLQNVTLAGMRNPVDKAEMAKKLTSSGNRVSCRVVPLTGTSLADVMTQVGERRCFTHRAVSVWLESDGEPICPVRDHQDEEIKAYEVMVMCKTANPLQQLLTSIGPERPRILASSENGNLLHVLCPQLEATRD